jgi:pilus assembly protein CpaB
MKAARLVVLGVALAAGGVAAYLASGSRKPAEAPKAPPVAQLQTVDVLVAKADLTRGQMIGPHDVGWQSWPAASANDRFIKKPARPDAVNQFAGAIVRQSLATGQPIYDPMVVFAHGSGFLAAILPKGMRAVAMEISPDSAAGGFILPEDHVDILLTRHDKAIERATGVDKLVSETILRNVRVLAVDQNVEEKNGQKSVIGRTVTVELTPRQAETLAMSRQLGTLSLTLRSLADSPSSTPEDGVERNDRTVAINTIRFGVSSVPTSH